MKMSKKFRAIASATLISAMVMSMSGMTALASTPATVKLQKDVTTDGKTFAPNTTFNFKLEAASADTHGGYKTLEGDTKGLASSVKINDVTVGNKANFELEFSASMSDAPQTVYSKEASLVFDTSNCTTPGIYHYTVEETSVSGVDGLTYDTVQRDLYVYVEYDLSTTEVETDTKVAGIVIKKGEDEAAYEPNADNSGKVSVLKFVNDYNNVTEEDPYGSTHDVIISKKITGNQGDRNHGFKFEIQITAAEDSQPNESYYVEFGTLNKKGEFVAGAENVVIKNKEVLTKYLANNDAVRIWGLSENDKYTVKEYEVDGDFNGYKTSINGKWVEATEENGIKVVSNGTNSTTNDETSVAYVNDKTVTTPTGIIMSFAPYILVLALAGVFAVMFLRKKREDF